MNIAGWCVVMLLTGVGFSNAAAQDIPPASAPDPVAGDTWTFRTTDRFSNSEINRYAMTFVGHDGEMLVYRIKNLVNNKGRTQRLTANLGTCQYSAEVNAQVCFSAYKFPLAIGGKSSIDRQPSSGTAGDASNDCKVVAFEKLTVPGGQFDTFRVECSGVWRAAAADGAWSSTVNFTNTHWYAPSVNAQVKYVTVVRDATASHSGAITKNELQELIEFKPGTPATTPVPRSDSASSGELK